MKKRQREEEEEGEKGDGEDDDEEEDEEEEEEEEDDEAATEKLPRGLDSKNCVRGFMPAKSPLPAPVDAGGRDRAPRESPVARSRGWG